MILLSPKSKLNMEVSSHDDNSFLLCRRESYAVLNPNNDLIPKLRGKAI